MCSPLQDFDGSKPQISYTKNGRDLGVAFTVTDDLQGEALVPHLLVKNTSIEINVGQRVGSHLTPLDIDSAPDALRKFHEIA